MKKFFTFITCVMVVVSAFATQPKFKQLENKPTLKPTIDAKYDRTDAYSAKFAKPEPKQLINAGQKFNKPESKVEETPKTPSLTARMDEIMPKYDPKNHSKLSETKDYHKWDSIQLFYPDGHIEQTMYLTYTIIDGVYWPALLTIKDMETGKIVGERGYEYHTEGPLKGELKSFHSRQLVYGYWDGGKEVYHYNAQGLIDTVFIYWPNMDTGAWELVAKYVYEWDANKNIVKLVIWQPLIETGEWVITTIQTAEYHPNGSRKKVVAWGWGLDYSDYTEKWMGFIDEYEWFMEDVPTLLRTFVWKYDGEPNTDIYWLTTNGVPTDGKFVGDTEVKREFFIGSGYLLMTLDKWSYWNEDNQDWNGNFDNGWQMQYNREERHTFSGAEYYHRRTGSICKKLVGTEWVSTHGGYTETYNWSQNPNPNGDWTWQVAIKSIIHGPGWWGDGDMIYQIDSIKYPKFEPNTHKGIVLYHKYINYPEMDMSGQEDMFKFNAAGKQIEWKQFALISEEMAEMMELPQRYGIYWETIEYDANNYPSKSRHYFCLYGMSGDDLSHWELVRVWVYEHVNGYRVYQMGWNDEAMTIPWIAGGRRLDFDWDIPLSDIIRWQDMYLDGDNMTGNPWFPALIKTKTILYVDWGSTDIDEYIEKYFYSIVKVGNSIQEPIIDGRKAAVVVYPNPVKDVLYVKTEQTVQQIFVFDLSGKLVMQTRGDNNSINLQSLSPGNYVARIQTDKAVVPVKIIKQ